MHPKLKKRFSLLVALAAVGELAAWMGKDRLERVIQFQGNVLLLLVVN